MTQECWRIPTCDEELVDVFLEEVEELLQSIDGHMKTWIFNPGDQKSLTEIRRCFHTLKGSGRMVKALDLSEVAWKVEHMLNQALGGTVAVSESMVNVVASVRTQIPRIVDAFKHHRSLAGNRDIEGLMRLADSLAAGKTSSPRAALRTVPATGERSGRPQDINARLDRCVQRADEALHRSELALQEARRAGVLLETLRSASVQPETNAELVGIRALVDGLSKEVLALRLRSEQGHHEGASCPIEMPRPVIERDAHLEPDPERPLGEIAQDDESVRPAGSVRHRFGWLALALSALAGGALATGINLWMQSLG